MNEKILSVMQKMIADPKLIAQVVRHGNEYYFKVLPGSFWSIKKWTEEGNTFYSLYLYPEYYNTLESLPDKNFNANDPESIPFMAFNTIGHPEVQFERTLMKLLEVVQTRCFGVDDILDSIIKD
jgi:hypothetical protein